MPTPTNYTSTGGSGGSSGSGGIGLGNVGAGAPRGGGLFNAGPGPNYVVQNIENPFGAALAAVVQMQATDPEGAKALYKQALQTYMTQAQEALQSGNPDIMFAARKMLGNPQLSMTAAQVGKDIGLPIVKVPQPGDVWQLPNWMDLLGIVGPSILGGVFGGGGNTPPPGGTTTPPPSGTPPPGGTPPPSGTPPPGTPPPDSGGFDLGKFLKDYAPLFASIGLNAWGGITAGNAAEKAAQIQADAAQKGIDETKRQYDTTRADLAPWRNAGRSGLQAISYGLGVNDPMTEKPFTGAPMSLARVGSQPNAARPTGPQRPNFDQLAAKYQGVR